MEENNKLKVVVYSTPSCMYCRMAKDYFKENSVEFTEHDVSVDEVARAEMSEKSGQMGVPVIVIGEEVIVGFDQDRIAPLLGL
ncbi:MAG: NrdH-redoxin [Candidatus Vogelbacteria bacterium CG10_big_fil_rev_8_21_14_0_10_45_14]|uniref:NrdH-redoxin n=1 Tax=Candidatus Vogelbacteria bacterium CG10_big_fil_rev_8_21_14_0_10_45_14 TaxID=1975042 RepID=A0A2H0RK91_9BACT|nr:MAG: NrdH-redoxin [Candidatus Vogelbacteria bacterium CG10_big_fil_rev_8_21_14_0_10_45_14]